MLPPSRKSPFLLTEEGGFGPPQPRQLLIAQLYLFSASILEGLLLLVLILFLILWFLFPQPLVESSSVPKSDTLGLPHPMPPPSCPHWDHPVILSAKWVTGSGRKWGHCCLYSLDSWILCSTLMSAQHPMQCWFTLASGGWCSILADSAGHSKALLGQQLLRCLMWNSQWLPWPCIHFISCAVTLRVPEAIQATQIRRFTLELGGLFTPKIQLWKTRYFNIPGPFLPAFS